MNTTTDTNNSNDFSSENQTLNQTEEDVAYGQSSQDSNLTDLEEVSNIASMPTVFPMSTDNDPSEVETDQTQNDRVFDLESGGNIDNHFDTWSVDPFVAASAEEPDFNQEPNPFGFTRSGILVEIDELIANWQQRRDSGFQGGDDWADDRTFIADEEYPGEFGPIPFVPVTLQNVQHQASNVSGVVEIPTIVVSGAEQFEVTNTPPVEILYSTSIDESESQPNKDFEPYLEERLPLPVEYLESNDEWESTDSEISDEEQEEIAYPKITLRNINSSSSSSSSSSNMTSVFAKSRPSQLTKGLNTTELEFQEQDEPVIAYYHSCIITPYGSMLENKVMSMPKADPSQLCLYANVTEGILSPEKTHTNNKIATVCFELVTPYAYDDTSDEEEEFQSMACIFDFEE